MLKANLLKERRKKRIRLRLRKVVGIRPRLTVFRSNKNIYAQIIDDQQGNTVVPLLPWIRRFGRDLSPVPQRSPQLLLVN